MFGILLFILALCLSVNGIKCDENATFTAEELDERSAKDGDYIGCFAQECLHFDYVANITEYITPDSCTATCKEHGFPYVAIHNRTECTCSCEQTCMNKQLDDKSCGLPCRGDLTIFCGGYHGASVYAVFNGSSGGRCNETMHFHGRDGNSTIGVDRRLPVIISAVAVLCVALTAGVMLGCFRQRHLRMQATANQSEDIESKEDPQSASRLASYLCTNVIAKSIQDLSADSNSRLYANAEHCLLPTYAVIEPSSNTSPRQTDDDLKAVKADRARDDSDEYHKYMDMNSKARKTRAEDSERDSTTDADGYIIHNGPPTDIPDISYEIVFLPNAKTTSR
eukprot:XP_011671299.1 PREDICTED: uncharacterized protein LOC105441654 [Strongylocentrotus purpuratus]